MIVKVFTKSANNPRFVDTLHKFSKGVRASGDECKIVDHIQYEECDCAVFFGSWKDRPDDHHVVKNNIVKYANKFICLETPLIGRGPVQDVMQDDWYRIGVGGFLADTGNFNNKNRPPDRWEMISKRLNVDIKPYHSGQYCIVALQLPQDASLRGASIEKWAAEWCRDFRKTSDMTIIVRTPQIQRHYDMQTLSSIAELEDVRFQVGTKDNLVPTLNGAAGVATYSSGMGVEALMNGCHTVASNSGSFVYDVCSNDVSGIIDQTEPNREQWIHDLAYCQWNIDEIEQGAAWRHLREVL